MGYLGGACNRCVQLLLKHGAQADLKDRVGVTALIAAVMKYLTIHCMEKSSLEYS